MMLTVCQAIFRTTAGDDVVTFHAHGADGADGADTEDGTGSGVHLASQRTELPSAAVKDVVDVHGVLRPQHAHVRQGQVNDVIVSGRFQFLLLGEHVHDDIVACWQKETVTKVETISASYQKDLTPSIVDD